MLPREREVRRTPAEWAAVRLDKAREFEELLRAFPVCQLCERRGSYSKHHLFPREIVKLLDAGPPPGSIERANGSFYTPKLAVCRTCHSNVHRLATNEELYHRYNNLEALRQLLREHHKIRQSR